MVCVLRLIDILDWVLCKHPRRRSGNLSIAKRCIWDIMIHLKRSLIVRVSLPNLARPSQPPSPNYSSSPDDPAPTPLALPTIPPTSPYPTPPVPDPAAVPHKSHSCRSQSTCPPSAPRPRGSPRSHPAPITTLLPRHSADSTIPCPAARTYQA